MSRPSSSAKPRRDERAGARGRLDDQGAVAESGDQAVADGEVAGQRLGSEGELGDQGAALGDLVAQPPATPGIVDVEAAAEDGEGRATARSRGGAVGGRVDAAGEAGDDREAVLRQMRGERARDVEPVRAGAAGADDRQTRPLGERAAYVEHGWRQRQLEEDPGVVSIQTSDDPRSTLLRFRALQSGRLFGPCQCRTGDGELAAPHSDAARVRLRGAGVGAPPRFGACAQSADGFAREIEVAIQRDEMARLQGREIGRGLGHGIAVGRSALAPAGICCRRA